MARRIRLGVIVPSSNTALEPLTSAIVSSISDADLDVSVHYSRFRVTTIDVSSAADAQFQLEPMVAAARLLADAEVDVIGWSGTSAGWLGFDRDEVLCKAIQDATGVPATSSILAMNALLRGLQRRGSSESVEKVKPKLALVTPYVKSVNDAIRANYAAIGHEITPERERYLGMTKNTDFGNVDESTLDAMVDEVVTEGGADVVAIYCTNLRGAGRAAYWEQRHRGSNGGGGGGSGSSRGVVVLDSIATTVWGMLQTLDGVDPACVKGWGAIFQQPTTNN
ncbi:hypothetical protein PV08_02476 [Exophiala spinifera]|uniref:Asp/Glu/hydantoin racemase n=1 Tax=Exophiala spinifera TaxID=91928 RepID=A0A0D2BGQ7_9EURO|nr:uncharacterized protein PV08_02476 [Exophiala spinifera]KIW18188.1 hypothetical protein PV08_02476 [Exophiala spinifera]